MKNDLIRRSELLAKKCMVRGHLDTGSPRPSKVTAIPVDVIERTPAVDAVEVVRCRDCEHWGSGKNESAPGDVCCVHLDATEPDAFCSYGERKEGVGNVREETDVGGNRQTDMQSKRAGRTSMPVRTAPMDRH